MFKQNESLAKYTTWKIGGAAREVYLPNTVDDLSVFLQSKSHNEPLVFIGAGSNLLVRDEGFDGTVVVTHRLLNALEFVAENEVWVQAGVPLMTLARCCAARGLVGLELLAGIPGTVGGALVMNAGAYGKQIWDFVEKVMVINQAGEIYVRKVEEYNTNYRSVTVFKREWFIAALLRLDCGNAIDSLRLIREKLSERRAKHPLEFPNAGSVFKNPLNDYAARLIEASKLKGYKIGGARISPKHANFIVNENRAKASDVEKLMHHIIDTVTRDHGIRLQREVRILGRTGILEDES